MLSTALCALTLSEALASLSGPEISPCRLPDQPEIPPYCPSMFISCRSITPHCTSLVDPVWFFSPSALWVNWLGIREGSEGKGRLVQGDCVLVERLNVSLSEGSCCLMMVYLMLLKAGSCRLRFRLKVWFRVWAWGRRLGVINDQWQCDPVVIVSRGQISSLSAQGTQDSYLCL